MDKTQSDKNVQLDRYDSLKSLCRLVENDMVHQLSTRSRSLLPIKQSTLNLYTIGVKWTKSCSTDHTRASSSTKEGPIKRLLPEVAVDDQSIRNKSNFVELETGNKANILNIYKYCEVSTSNCCKQKGCNANSLEYLTKEGKPSHSNIVERGIDDLRQRVARFEAFKNIPNPVYADDFQQYLGACYLEIDRTQNNRTGQMPYILNPTNSKHLATSLSSSSSLHTVQSYSGNISNYVTESKNISAGLSKGNECLPELSYILPQQPKEDSRDESTGNPDQLEEKKKPALRNSENSDGYEIVPIRNDLKGEYLKTTSGPRIPHHAANRARSRHFKSRRLISVISQLRRFPTTITVQKS